jgi:DNA-directed RNA polymerase alpha subunit
MKLTFETIEIEDMFELCKFLLAIKNKKLEQNKFNDDIYSKKIDECFFPVRVQNAFSCNGIKTLADLCKYSINDLKKIPNLGSNSIKEVIAELNRHNVSLSKLGLATTYIQVSGE